MLWRTIERVRLLCVVFGRDGVPRFTRMTRGKVNPRARTRKTAEKKEIERPRTVIPQWEIPMVGMVMPIQGCLRVVVFVW